MDSHSIADIIRTADMAIKSTTSLINLIGAIKNSPKKIATLRTEVIGLGNAIVRVRTVLANSTPSSHSIDGFEQVLTGCQETLCRVSSELNQLSAASSRGGVIVTRVQSRANYNLSDQRIMDICNEVEGRKSTLLVLSGCYEN